MNALIFIDGGFIVVDDIVWGTKKQRFDGYIGYLP
jgi:hypothetical protein